MSASVFEEHSAVLAHWWHAGARARTVVYLDAHLDLQHISADRMRRLVECTSAERVAALAKPHHLCPDRGYSYGLENFLYPAVRLGLIGPTPPSKVLTSVKCSHSKPAETLCFLIQGGPV